MKISLRHISTVYILLLMLVKGMALPFIVLQYNVNKDYIANNLCVNKAKPVMQCHGSCHLSKKLAKSLENPESANDKTGTKLASVDFFQTIPPLSFQSDFSIDYEFSSERNNSMPVGFSPAIFHPPAAC